MRTTFGLLVAGVGFCCLAEAVVAHHSFGVEYDIKKPVKVTGVVTKLEWTNPHAHLYVDVVDQKGTKVKQNTDAIINAHNHGFYTIAFLVIGMAGETIETMKETQDWLLSVKPYLNSCNLAVGIPYPGSRWWTHPQESGIDIVDYNYDNQWIVGFSARDEILVRPHGATVEEMFKIKREMFDFLVYHGWAKQEWQEDSRIRKQQEEAEKLGTLTAASTLTYAGH